MEKGYRHWGHDIGEEDTPYNGGSRLRGGDRTSRAASSAARRLLKQKAEGPLARRLVQLKLTADQTCRCSITTSRLRNGERVGSVTSGAYGHRVGASLGTWLRQQ
jgi:glycine cleavage system aminomethyltransferase T